MIKNIYPEQESCLPYSMTEIPNAWVVRALRIDFVTWTQPVASSLRFASYVKWYFFLFIYCFWKNEKNIFRESYINEQRSNFFFIYEFKRVTIQGLFTWFTDFTLLIVKLGARKVTKYLDNHSFLSNNMYEL